jgi:L-phenylalanine/L-methionine N-acetyltransferase
MEREMNHSYSDPDQPASAASGVAGLIVRAARSSDCEALTELANMTGYRHGTLRLPFQSLEKTRQRLEGAGPNMLTLVAAVGDRIVGDAGLECYAGRRAHVGQIGMGIRDDWQRRGVGTALLGALVDTADNWLNLRRIELTVYVDNAPAIRLYEKFGFEREGVCRAYAFRNGGYVDAISMARLRCLSPPTA